MKEFSYVITDSEGLAVKCGEEIGMTAEGADEAEAIAAIETFLKENL